MYGKIKRLASLILTVLTGMSLLPTAAFATDSTYQDPISGVGYTITDSTSDTTSIADAAENVIVGNPAQAADETPITDMVENEAVGESAQFEINDVTAAEPAAVSATQGTTDQGILWSIVGDTLHLDGSASEKGYLDSLSSIWENCGPDVKKVTMEGITSIGFNVFSGCSSLQEITIPDNVTSIGGNAFGGCSSLQEITIPGSVTSINGYTFRDCSSLQKITIPSGVTSIGSGAFSGCSKLCEITIPDGVTSIDNNAFSGCSSLQEMTIPDSITSIGDSVFSRCSSLQKISLPASVTSIGGTAFMNCSSLQEITIPENVTSIGYNAFKNCSSLQEITIPGSVMSIGVCAFSGCRSLQEITIPYNVTSIGSETFYGCSSLQRISLPDSLASIDRYAFYGCSSLQEITIPSNVTSIDGGAFKNCSSLQEIMIPGSVTSIDGGAFQGCSSLREITISDGVTSIGSQSFRECNSLQEITIPSSITSIEDGAFWGCSSLQKVTISDGVTSIDGGAFKNCSSLQEIMIPDSVSSLGGEAFQECSSLQEITILGNVTSIGDMTFSNCSLLQKVSLPASVTSIGKCAFYGCRFLQEVEIPESVTSIGERAFNGCRSLQEITIPSGVTSIEFATFQCCWSLQAVIIPRSVTSISESAFFDCGALRDVYYAGNEAQWKKVEGHFDEQYISENGITIHYNSTGPSSTQPDELNEARITLAELAQIAQAYREGRATLAELTDAATKYGMKSVASLAQQFAPIPPEEGWISAIKESSTKFNKDLARAAAKLSDKSWYGEDEIKNLYKEWGIKDCETFGYTKGTDIGIVELSSDGNAFAIGYKTLDIDGTPTTLLVVTARGSKTLGEFMGDALKGSPVYISWYRTSCKDWEDFEAWKNVYDFEEALQSGLLKYLTDHPAISPSKRKLKILITGHSLGGAAANMLGAYINCRGVPVATNIDSVPIDWEIPKEDVYVYTFNAIKVLCTKNNKPDGYENIHNVYNLWDSVGPESPILGLRLVGASSPGTKFGHTHIYMLDGRGGAFDVLDAHTNYIRALDQPIVEETCTAIHDQGHGLW